MEEAKKAKYENYVILKWRWSSGRRVHEVTNLRKRNFNFDTKTNKDH